MTRARRVARAARPSGGSCDNYPIIIAQFTKLVKSRSSSRGGNPSREQKFSIGTPVASSIRRLRRSTDRQTGQCDPSDVLLEQAHDKLCR